MDLDAIIEAHLLYLREITEKGFLDGGKNQALSERLNAMFDTILKYKIILDHLYAYITKPSEPGAKSNATGSAERLQKIRSRHSEIENKFEASSMYCFSLVSITHIPSRIKSMSSWISLFPHTMTKTSALFPPVWTTTITTPTFNLAHPP